jgi:hypothetical protein
MGLRFDFDFEAFRWQTYRSSFNLPAANCSLKMIVSDMKVIHKIKTIIYPRNDVYYELLTEDCPLITVH